MIRIYIESRSLELREPCNNYGDLKGFPGIISGLLVPNAVVGPFRY